MNIILLGAPGAGKGTLAEILQSKLSLIPVSTGNIIRETLRSGSELGKQAKDIVESGRLLPDEMVVNIMKEKLKDLKGGFMLDGFPRTIAQADALEAMQIQIDAVLNVETKDETIVQRLAGRVVCEKCGSSYHLKNKPSSEDGICDLCHGNLIRRKDDNPDTIKNRLDVYHKETKPLVLYYKNKGKLLSIDGEGGIEKLTQSALSALKSIR